MRCRNLVQGERHKACFNTRAAAEVIQKRQEHTKIILRDRPMVALLCKASVEATKGRAHRELINRTHHNNSSKYINDNGRRQENHLFDGWREQDHPTDSETDTEEHIPQLLLRCQNRHHRSQWLGKINSCKMYSIPLPLSFIRRNK